MARLRLGGAVLRASVLAALGVAIASAPQAHADAWCSDGVDCGAACGDGCPPNEEQWFEEPWIGAPPSSTPAAPSAPGMTPTPAAPSTPAPAPASPNFGGQDFGGADPLPSLARSGLGAQRASRSAVPSMIGDFFNTGLIYGSATAPFGAENATAAVGGGDRFFKFSENNTPFPQDRVFFNYNLFANAVDVTGDAGGTSSAIDVHRFVFGAEKTFYNDLMSVEFRVPFAAGVDSFQASGAANEAAEFGNLAFVLKGLLYQQRGWSVGGGLGFILPTADDAVLANDSSEEQLIYENDSLYLQPFLGVSYMPNDRLFTQFFVQLNFDATGSDIFVPGSSSLSQNATGDDEAENVDTQTLLFLDYSLGYWIYRDNGCRCRDRFITGIAPMFEIHYTTTTEALDLGSFEGAGLFSEDRRRDVLNLTGALLFELGPDTNLRVSGVAPVRDGTDAIFDSEFGLQLIRRY